MHKRLVRGLTLIELMITVALLVIVLAIGVPSFQGAINSSRLTAAANVVPQVTVAAEPPSKVTVEPLNPIVSSEGVTYPQSSDTKADAAEYDPRHDKN